jgi:taurine--2-oxoglutarate transaminase
MITMAKGLTSAYAPLGAIGMKREIADAFRKRPFVSGLTYNGHPISLAAAIANIDVIQEDGLIQRSAQTGQLLKQKLHELKEKHPSVGDVRSIGLISIIELVKNRQTKEPFAPFNGTSPEMKAVSEFIQSNGVFLYVHWHTILVIPPLIITPEQLEQGIAVIDKALEITDRATVG